MTTELSNGAQLDEQGLRLLHLLVSKLPDIKPDDPRTFLSYKQIHEALKLPQEGQTLGRSLQHQGLDSLATWTESSGYPGITGLIIDKEKLSPGPGYFKLFSRRPDDYQWWLSEIQNSKSFDWKPFLSNTSASTNNSPLDNWSDEELRASVNAYLEMLALHRQGTPFTKKKYYDSLSERFGRTAKAFEYRMQNISYVLSLMGRDWLTGLKPAKNVGANVAAQIEKLIAEAEGRQATPVAAFEIAVRETIRRNAALQPEGARSPEAITVTVTQFKRDVSVRAWVLKNADGICECCDQAAPFQGVDGLPFLEVHHVRKLADGGTDTIKNAVAACPNCHRALHYGMYSKELLENLYQKVQRLEKE